jgi:hypothetical protein
MPRGSEDAGEIDGNDTLAPDKKENKSYEAS